MSRKFVGPWCDQNIKRYYIYVVLAFLSCSFLSMAKILEQVGPVWARQSFLSPDSLINLLRSAVPILTLSGAYTLLMIAGQIDLSVGSAMSLSAVGYTPG